MQINKFWFQIIYDDPFFLPGKSIKEMIECICKVKQFKYVILNDINGFGKGELVWNLSQREGEIIKLEEFLESCNHIGGFEWCDFFLLEEKTKEQFIIDDLPYSKIIAYSDTTVRAIDGQYLYVYTPDESIVNALEKN